MKHWRFFYFSILPILLLAAFGCESKGPSVVVYTSHDQIFSEPVLKMFEKETGIEVLPVYDVEAAKTTGLVNRLLAERDNPVCDVFWNNEIGRTLALKEKGLLQPYESPSAAGIPARFKDAEGYWTGFAARTRVILYNPQVDDTKNPPASIFDFVKPEWKGRFAMAEPLFGTTATHAAALVAFLGDKKAEEFFRSLARNGAVIVQGNSVVKDQVAAGELAAGLTDTDDANLAVLDGKPVEVIFPDRDGIGTLLIPNTVCIVKDCPNPGNAKKLVDFLLEERIERMLAFSPSAQIPLRDRVERPESLPDLTSLKVMDVSYEQIAANMDKAARLVQSVFSK